MKNLMHADKIPYEQIKTSIEIGIFDNLHIAVALISESMEFEYCNQSFISMYGLPQDICGQRLNNYILTDKKHIEESLKTHKIVVCMSQSRNDACGIVMSYPIYDETLRYRGVFVESVPVNTSREVLDDLMESMRTVEMEIYPHQPRAPKKKSLCTFSSIVGESESIQALRKLGRKVANSHESILISGESGTGKELVAQALHMASPRADGPFICVNCAALPADLMESELFGYESGSFTGARSSGMKGRFEEAHNGTIFLDEIGEMPLAVQAKLLRVLESGEIQKIGHKGHLCSDFRLVAATNRNLLEMVINRKFREDLYHRLNVFELDIPPLREREDDILALTRFFITSSLGQARGQSIRLDEALVKILVTHPWPGNVRELKNVMTHALFLLGEDENVLTVSHLPSRFGYNPSLCQPKYTTPSSQEYTDPLEQPLTGYRAGVSAPLSSSHGASASRQDERSILQETLVRCHYNKVTVAKVLGISRSKLYRDLRKYGLQDDCLPRQKSGNS